MTLEVRALRLRVATTAGNAGAYVDFTPGLNVIRGANSRGKTQIMQAIIYGLGLEALFGPGTSTRLGSALTHQVRLALGPERVEQEAAVLASWVALELFNGEDVLALWRPVVNEKYGQNLVRVWRGPLLTDGSGEVDGDYFVRESGAVQRTRGFHHLLAEFVGWHLPVVPRYTGGTTLLYPEILAPFFYADQRAWGSAAPRSVVQFQIREPTRKAVEFLLGLVGPAAEARRAEIDSELLSLRSAWTSAVDGTHSAVGAAGARLVGLPNAPAGARKGSGRPVQPTDVHEAAVEVLQQNEWRPLEEVRAALAETVAALQRPAAAATVGAAGASGLGEELATLHSELGDALAASSVIEQNLLLNESQLVALDRRMDALVEEQRRNHDVKTLLRLGSDHAATHLADTNCPTCNQALAGVEGDAVVPSLDVDGTLRLLNAQLATARGMREQAQAAVQAARDAFRALQNQADGLRARIRAIENDLVAPDHAVSESTITHRIVAETRLAELGRAADTAAAVLTRLQDLADRTAALRTELDGLPAGLTTEDQQRLDRLTEMMQAQLRDFGFDSYSADRIMLDPETLRPQRSGFDLDADVSASDVVRVKIAYLNSIRELSESVGGQHPGLLMLDEPRQHELDEQHFRAALNRLSATAASGQVIVSSAAAGTDLARLLGSADAHVIDLGADRLLQPDNTSDPFAEADADGVDFPKA